MWWKNEQHPLFLEYASQPGAEQWMNQERARVKAVAPPDLCLARNNHPFGRGLYLQSCSRMSGRQNLVLIGHIQLGILHNAGVYNHIWDHGPTSSMAGIGHNLASRTVTLSFICQTMGKAG
jgi:hypothetical protein